MVSDIEGGMGRRDISSPQALAAIERARRLLNRAYDKATTRGEREFALASATKTLAPFGLTVEDMKEESQPDYLTAIKAQSGQFNMRTAKNMARALHRGGWVAQDPRDHGYQGGKREKDKEID